MACTTTVPLPTATTVPQQPATSSVGTSSPEIFTPVPSVVGNSSSELVIWTVGIGFSLECCTELGIKLVKSGLFRLNANLEAEPDLAARPCEVADDLVTIDCTLREATFHDGTPFTAQDVVFTMALRMSDACGEDPCLFGPPASVRRVEAPDARTVRFVLKEPDPTFLTSWLPYEMLSVESERVVTAAYTALAQQAADLEPGAIEAAQAALSDLESQQGPDCEAALPEAEQVITTTGATTEPRSNFGIGSAFDACEYAGYLHERLGRLALALESAGTDAIAAGYPLLGQDTRAIGTGPFQVVSVDRDEAVLEAYDGYHFGRPATDRVRLLLTNDARDAATRMAGGDGNVLDLDEESFSVLREDNAVRIIEHSSLGYLALLYNLRAGRLFEQVELRQALQLCVDKAAIVDAATSGDGIPLDSPVPPVSWAYQESAPVERDVEAGRRLIEHAGWTAGDDGVYELDGRRLSASIVVRADDEERVRFVELVAFQAADCGWDLQLQPVSPDEYFAMIENYPHLRPGTSEPFDLYLGGWNVGPDPGFEQWYSGLASSEENPDGVNLIGMDDPRFDELFAEWRTAYDPTQRARLSRLLQQILLEDQPYLFGWSGRDRVAVSRSLRSTAGPLVESPYWWWQIETLTTASAP